MIIQTLTQSECPFGIVGGGHGDFAGSNSVKDGVTIDFGKHRVHNVDDGRLSMIDTIKATSTLPHTMLTERLRRLALDLPGKPSTRLSSHSALQSLVVEQEVLVPVACKASVILSFSPH